MTTTTTTTTFPNRPTRRAGELAKRSIHRQYKDPFQVRRLGFNPFADNDITGLPQVSEQQHPRQRLDHHHQLWPDDTSDSEYHDEHSQVKAANAATTTTTATITYTDTREKTPIMSAEDLVARGSLWVGNGGGLWAGDEPRRTMEVVDMPLSSTLNFSPVHVAVVPAAEALESPRAHFIHEPPPTSPPQLLVRREIPVRSPTPELEAVRLRKHKERVQAWMLDTKGLIARRRRKKGRRLQRRRRLVSDDTQAATTTATTHQVQSGQNLQATVPRHVDSLAWSDQDFDTRVVGDRKRKRRLELKRLREWKKKKRKLPATMIGRDGAVSPGLFPIDGIDRPSGNNNSNSNSNINHNNYNSNKFLSISDSELRSGYTLKKKTVKTVVNNKQDRVSSQEPPVKRRRKTASEKRQEAQRTIDDFADLFLQQVDGHLFAPHAIATTTNTTATKTPRTDPDFVRVAKKHYRKWKQQKGMSQLDVLRRDSQSSDPQKAVRQLKRKDIQILEESDSAGDVARKVRQIVKKYNQDVRQKKKRTPPRKEPVERMRPSAVELSEESDDTDTVRKSQRTSKKKKKPLIALLNTKKFRRKAVAKVPSIPASLLAMDIDIPPAQEPHSTGFGSPIPHFRTSPRRRVGKKSSRPVKKKSIAVVPKNTRQLSLVESFHQAPPKLSYRTEVGDEFELLEMPEDGAPPEYMGFMAVDDETLKSRFQELWQVCTCTLQSEIVTKVMGQNAAFQSQWMQGIEFVHSAYNCTQVRPMLLSELNFLLTGLRQQLVTACVSQQSLATLGSFPRTLSILLELSQFEILANTASPDASKNKEKFLKELLQVLLDAMARHPLVRLPEAEHSLWFGNPVEELWRSMLHVWSIVFQMEMLAEGSWTLLDSMVCDYIAGEPSRLETRLLTVFRMWNFLGICIPKDSPFSAFIWKSVSSLLERIKRSNCSGPAPRRETIMRLATEFILAFHTVHPIQDRGFRILSFLGAIGVPFKETVSAVEEKREGQFFKRTLVKDLWPFTMRPSNGMYSVTLDQQSSSLLQLLLLYLKLECTNVCTFENDRAIHGHDIDPNALRSQEAVFKKITSQLLLNQIPSRPVIFDSHTAKVPLLQSFMKMMLIFGLVAPVHQKQSFSIYLDRLVDFDKSGDIYARLLYLQGHLFIIKILLDFGQEVPEKLVTLFFQKFQRFTAEFHNNEARRGQPVLFRGSTNTFRTYEPASNTDGFRSDIEYQQWHQRQNQMAESICQVLHDLNSVMVSITAFHPQAFVLARSGRLMM